MSGALTGAAVTIGGRQSARSDSTTWLTPRWILNALGRFDLDPCAAPNPGEWPTATSHIAEPRDGLAEPWYGRVFLNPPYSKQGGRWVARLAEHGIGTALLFHRHDAAWFADGVLEHPSTTGMLLLRGRVKFHKPVTYDAPDNGGAPSTLVAYGHRDAEILSTCGLRGTFVALNGWTPSSPRDTSDLITPAGWRTGISDRAAAGPVRRA